jgi:hypothetical protein
VTERELLAVQQVGMYRALVDVDVFFSGWRAAFAKAVGHAALGEQAAAKEEVARFVAKTAPDSVSSQNMKVFLLRKPSALP